nr:MAG: hypothetical protein [Apis mellifera filamentous virus]
MRVFSTAAAVTAATVSASCGRHSEKPFALRGNLVQQYKLIRWLSLTVSSWYSWPPSATTHTVGTAFTRFESSRKSEAS